MAAAADLNSENLANLRVKDVINPTNKEWNLATVSHQIPVDLVSKIHSIPININVNNVDKIVWSHGKNSMVSVKEAYKFLISRNLGNQNTNLDWKYLWGSNCPQKFNSSCGNFATINYT